MKIIALLIWWWVFIYCYFYLIIKFFWWLSYFPNKILIFADEHIIYSWFLDRTLASIIDLLLSLLIIPLFLNLYFWTKDGQTIWYKIFWIRVYNIDWDKLTFPSGGQLFFYPFFKLLYIWCIFILLTKRKQWLHNIISGTVVININTLKKA